MIEFERPVPDPRRASTDESDCHEVDSHAVPPTPAAALFRIVPIPPPSTVARTPATVGWLVAANDREAALTPAVTATCSPCRTPLTVAVALQDKAECEAQSVTSQTVPSIREPSDAAVIPNPSPETCTLSTAPDAKLRGFIAETEASSYEKPADKLPTWIPLVTTNPRLAPFPADILHASAESELHSVACAFELSCRSRRDGLYAPKLAP
eukprot:2021677-Rhodomonas_salina.1